MDASSCTRRDLPKMAGLGTAIAATSAFSDGAETKRTQTVRKDFFIRPEELTVKFRRRGLSPRSGIGPETVPTKASVKPKAKNTKLTALLSF